VLSAAGAGPPRPTLPLTPEEQARLDALPAASQTILLAWLLSSDRILVAEARAKLKPPAPRPLAPRSLPELLSRIRESPDYPAAAAQALCQALGDAKSYAGFKARCDAAYLGELEPRWLVSAYEQALGPKARNRGALFQSVLKQRE
jgi:hypothetical protein